ncbi:uncharacterized protein ARMOST_19073 [Armillaria ostoyae]|uniref:F-box domain-containing protein n=1 Tax=Armillaria ostoyae TaxID=47428 RepID=A0A284S3I1_ARMOS|nr:uncharacterized protein ARMOST_19073 [Armillaria ostoyae]
MSSNSDDASLDEPKNKNFVDEIPNELLLVIFSCGAQSTDGTAFSFRVCTVCQRWRSLAINNAYLWTSLTIDTAIPPLSTLQVPLSYFSTIFPKEALVLERSSNLDVDITIANSLGSPKYTPKHFEFLSTLLSTHARHIRTLDVHVEHAISASKLCSRLHRVALPRLQKFHLISDYTFEDLFDHEDEDYDPFCSTHMLEYSHEDNIPTSVDLQQWSTSKYPTLTDVACAGIPLEWGLFSPSNLRTLCLRSGIQRAPSMEILRGILFNSMNTLESLELADIINWADPSDLHPAKARLTLPRVHTLIIGNRTPNEVRFAVQAFAFPTLRNLTIKCPLGGPESDIFVSLIRYLPLDELHKLKFPVTCFRETVLPDPDLVKEGNIAEDSLPLMLQFIRRLTSLHTLELMCFCDTAELDCSWCSLFLRLMNYPVTDLKDERNGALNLFGLQRLSIKADGHMSPEALSFLRKRLELGTVNGEYVGPVFEKLTLSLWSRIQWQEEDQSFLNDVTLAKEQSIVFF